MHIPDVQCDFSAADKIFQIEIHAPRLGDKPDGRVDADRNDPLLHVGGRA